METLKLTITLGIICVIAGSLLATGNWLTADKIAQVRKQELVESLRTTLPSFDNSPVDEAVAVQDDKQGAVSVYKATKSGQPQGVAFSWVDPTGYSGDITVLMGMDMKGTLTGLRILQHAETPGLGAKITEKSFISQFIGKNLENTKWAVKKDGGDIDAITGATISPRSVTTAIHQGLQFFKKHKQSIVSGEKGNHAPLFNKPKEADAQYDAGTQNTLNLNSIPQVCTNLAVVKHKLATNIREQDKQCFAKMSQELSDCLCNVSWKHTYDIPSGDEQIKQTLKNAASSSNWEAVAQMVCKLSDVASPDRMVYLMKVLLAGKICEPTAACITSVIDACPALGLKKSPSPAAGSSHE